MNCGVPLAWQASSHHWAGDETGVDNFDQFEGVTTSNHNTELPAPVELAESERCRKRPITANTLLEHKLAGDYCINDEAGNKAYGDLSLNEESHDFASKRRKASSPSLLCLGSQNPIEINRLYTSESCDWTSLLMKRSNSMENMTDITQEENNTNTCL